MSRAPVPLVVGMPVYRRAWILDRWFDSFEAQDPPGRTVLLFGLSPSEDGTERIIHDRCRRGGWRFEVLDADGLPTFGDDERDADSRYAVLAQVRNVLLRRVAALSPAAYLSWDSDIVLASDALRRLESVLRDPGIVGAPRPDAVGAAIDMGGDVFPGHWSWMRLVDGEPYRFPVDENSLDRIAPFPIDVICGAKLMGPRAYRDARYADHLWGEDVAWAIQCEAMGISRWVAPRARGVHHYRLPAKS